MNSVTGKNALIIMTRYGEPGKVKTRLIPALGRYGAAELHSSMARLTVRTALCFMQPVPCQTSLHIFCAGTDPDRAERWLQVKASYLPQPEGDLGWRMESAFAAVFAAGADSAVMIGTDCPFISPHTLELAFADLSDHDAVIGPACDGGYYLIALKEKRPPLFRGISWGTGAVLEETVASAESLGLSVKLLRRFPDIDRPEDLAYIHPAMAAFNWSYPG